MQRYLLFAGESYYPFGGWEDFLEDFDYLNDAEEAAQKLGAGGWWHIVDTVTRQIVKDYDSVAAQAQLKRKL